MALTKADFLAEYERLHLEANEDIERAKKWFGGIRATLGRDGDRVIWDIVNDRHAIAAWKLIGGVGKPSVPALRRLPEGDDATTV